MTKIKLKCPKCSGDYLEPQAPTFSDMILSLVKNTHKRYRCLSCLWTGLITYKLHKHRGEVRGV